VDKVTLRVNGATREIDGPPEQSLLDALRDGLGLLSVREGCGIGMCGACTVLVDGRPISACLTLAGLMEGRDLVTVEGLGENGALDLVQEAFLACTGFQCSYCTPGILLTVKALLDEQPDASDEAIREYLSGNLCRCGSYVKIVDSVHAAIQRGRTAAAS
jgi:aerobic-type carbon monoxide dehydrogenase small subunit (CoxS/CutS family)